MEFSSITSTMFNSNSLSIAASSNSDFTRSAHLLNYSLNAVHWILIISDGLLWAFVLSAVFMLIVRRVMRNQRERVLNFAKKGSSRNLSSRGRNLKTFHPKTCLPNGGYESDLSTEVGTSESESESEFEQDLSTGLFSNVLGNSTTKWTPVEVKNHSKPLIPPRTQVSRRKPCFAGDICDLSAPHLMAVPPRPTFTEKSGFEGPEKEFPVPELPYSNDEPFAQLFRF